MNKEQLEAFNSLVIGVSIITIIIGIIIWFIFIVQSGVEETRLKHETCMVETFIYESSNKTEVIEYCGPNNQGTTK